MTRHEPYWLFSQLRCASQLVGSEGTGRLKSWYMLPSTRVLEKEGMGLSTSGLFFGHHQAFIIKRTLAAWGACIDMYIFKG